MFMLRTEERVDEAHVAQYYASGWRSLTEFLKRNCSSNVTYHEANPAAAFLDGIRLAPLHTVREDFAAAKPKILRQACSLADRPDLAYVEFGVRAGLSMSLVAGAIKHPSARFYGLDTFTGLPEGWVPAYGNRGGAIDTPRPPGQMAVKNMPNIDDRRVVLLKGLFQDTLPVVLTQLGGRPLFINVDCDTYTGALYALTAIHPYVKSGDVIYFDEFVDELNEFAAFNDYVRSYYVRDRMKLVARAYDGFLFVVT